MTDTSSGLQDLAKQLSSLVDDQALFVDIHKESHFPHEPSPVPWNVDDPNDVIIFETGHAQGLREVVDILQKFIDGDEAGANEDIVRLKELCSLYTQGEAAYSSGIKAKTFMNRFKGLPEDVAELAAWLEVHKDTSMLDK